MGGKLFKNARQTPSFSSGQTCFQLDSIHVWLFHRMRRIEAHASRIHADLRTLGPRASFQPRFFQTRPRPVWCVELARRFPSTSAAGRFVGRTAANIATAIARRGQCAGLTWQDYDPARHHFKTCKNWNESRRFNSRARAAADARHRQGSSRASLRH